jgi:predicted RNase H-like HicB family nuclease
MTMRYKIVLEHTDEGVTATVPGLPGCISEGKSDDEALANIRVAIREYLEVVAESTVGRDVREIEVAV